LKHEKDILIPGELGINPYTYLDIVLKYEFYLKFINYFGGYMFLKHIYKFSPKLEHQVFIDIHAMQKSNLLKIININNNSYILLLNASVKYLRNKSNVARIDSPTSNQLKTSCFLAEYISEPKEFFNSSKPYTWFIEKCKNEVKKYRNDRSTANMKFLNSSKEIAKVVIDQEKKSHELNDFFSKLKASRIYFDTFKDGVVTLIILDFERSKTWIYNTLLNKIEPIFRRLAIYISYDIKILTANERREERLNKDINTISHKGIIFLRNLDVINLNLESFFQSSVQTESFLKDIDNFEIEALHEKLRINSE